MHARYAWPLALTLALGLLVALAVAAQDATPAVDAEANKALARRFYDAFNQRDLDAFGTFIAADVVDHAPAPGQTPGLADLTESLTSLGTDFPDGQFTIDA